MNVRVNLLPEARLHKIKLQARRRQYSAFASITAGIVVSVSIVLGMLQVFLLSTHGMNEARIKGLESEIAKSKDMEQRTATLQANLASFYRLNTDRTYASRIFTNLVNTIPFGVTVGSFEISESDMTTINGTANSYAEVASFANALKQYNLDFMPQPDLDRKAVFTDIKIESVAKDENTSRVSFVLTFGADKDLLRQQGETK